MSSVETLIPLALRLGRAAFVKEHEGFHLLKPPTRNDARVEYTTLVADERELDPSHIMPSSDVWQTTPVRKRPGNPYLYRVSVGRAPNCDVVLRFPEVSKLHAHFLLDLGDALHLRDLGSANGTELNGTALGEQPAVVTPGDTISFGGIECRLVDADGLFRLVTGTNERR